MRLSELLGRLKENELRAIAEHRITDAESMSPGKLAAELETMIRSLAYVQKTLIASLPPTFSILLCLVEAEAGRLSELELTHRVQEHCEKLTADVASDVILGKTDDRLYRRVLAEAWRTDLSLHPDEIGLLGVLRHELGLFLVDHYLICYHPDFFEYWQEENAVQRELTALCAAGLVSFVDGDVVLAEEIAPQVSRALGIFLPRESYRRLLCWVPNPVLADVLRNSNMPIGGSKPERIDRLVARMIPPVEVLGLVGAGQMQDMATHLGFAKSGTRDVLMDRLIEHFRLGLDHPAPEELPAELPTEVKQLALSNFIALFESLSGRELSQILESLPELPQSGTKGVRVTNLWSSRYSEASLLGELTNRQLSEVLARHELLLGGSKSDRTRRIIEFFGSSSSATSPVATES